MGFIPDWDHSVSHQDGRQLPGAQPVSRAMFFCHAPGGGWRSSRLAVLDGLPEPRADLVGSSAGIDHAGEGFIFERKEDFAAALEVFALFERVGGVAPGTDALKGHVHIDIQNQQEVGNRRELLVETADFSGIEAARSLIGHGREIISMQASKLLLLELKDVFRRVSKTLRVSFNGIF